MSVDMPYMAIIQPCIFGTMPYRAIIQPYRLMSSAYMARIQPYIAIQPYMAEINPCLNIIRPYKAFVEPFMSRQPIMNQMQPNLAIAHMMYNDKMQPTTFLNPPAIPANRPIMAVDKFTQPFNQKPKSISQSSICINQSTISVYQPENISNTLNIHPSEPRLHLNQITMAEKQRDTNKYMNQTAMSMNQSMTAKNQRAMYTSSTFTNQFTTAMNRPIMFTKKTENLPTLQWNKSSMAVNDAKYDYQSCLNVNQFLGEPVRPTGQINQPSLTPPRFPSISRHRPDKPNKTTYPN